MESGSESVPITVEALKAELIKRAAELVINRGMYELQKKVKIEFKNLHGVAKKLKEKLVCWEVTEMLMNRM